LTIKPQLTVVLLLCVLLWAVRQRRWRVLTAFLVTLGLLAGVSTLIVPSWPLQMLHAPSQTPPPTAEYPWIGTTWWLVLRTVGLEGWRLWLAYAAVALAFLAVAVRAALERARPVSEVLALSLMAAFFVAPYARHYDFTVLLVPALVLAAGLAKGARVVLFLGLVLVPYGQYVVLARHKEATDAGGKFLVEGTFFWIPVLLAGLWLAYKRQKASSSGF
jgi:hypothetical protein